MADEQTLIPGGRWVPKDWPRWDHLIRSGGGCLWCGRGGNLTTEDRQMHRAGTCLACGTVQCNGNAKCYACLVGWMPNWSRGMGSRDARLCGYKGCDRDAVAEAPRVGRVCEGCLDRPKLKQWGGTTITLRERIARNVAEATQGAGDWRSDWRRMVYREPAKAVS
jgi:hypothetical protein